MELKQWIPRVIVIGPGGVKGLKVLGFLASLEDSGILEYVDTYCGVSIGAIICLLMIVGYKIREIIGIAVDIDVFKDIELFNFRGMIENRGLISSEPTRKRLTDLILKKLGVIPDLHNLYLMTGKSFTAVTLNATDVKCEMMNPF